MGAAADCMLSQMMAESCTTVWRLPRLALPRQNLSSQINGPLLARRPVVSDK